MNFKRALWVGVVTYIVSLIIGMIVMAIMGINPASLDEVSQSAIVANIIVTLFVAAFFTWFYFRDNSIKPSAKEGLYFGLVLIVIGFILDVLMFSLFSALTESQQSLMDYYSNPLFWLALVLFVAVTTIVGALKARK